MMKAFLIIWFTASVVTLVFVDHNTYISRMETKVLKHRALIPERLAVSIVAAGIYSAATSLLIHYTKRR